MVATPSTMLPLGIEAPDFALPDPAGTLHRRDDFADAPALLVMFICNHCPYVKHIRERLAEVAATLIDQGAAVVAVQSNDVQAYPDDGPERMAEEAQTYGYRFPYLYDESQEVARTYGAACTPDFFLFDADRRLAYRGQFDDSRPRNDVPVTGADLAAAAEAVLAGEPVPDDQRPSVGCNIKWKAGMAPDQVT